MTNLDRAHVGVLAASLVACATATAGPDWEEGLAQTGDAGKLPATSQQPVGPELTPLHSIQGELEQFSFTLGPGGPGDFQDMYLIYIDAPVSAFTASTETAFGGMTSFDSQLWLFEVSGLGILGVDGIGTGATLVSAATDSSGALVGSPGLYLIAISAVDSDPINSGGLPLFFQGAPGEVSGPDGSGGSTPIDDWSPSVTGGTYLIMLTGVLFPPQCVEDCGGGGSSAVDVTDLLAVLSEWGTSPPHACDVAPYPAPDGIIDISDLLAVLAAWGGC